MLNLESGTENVVESVSCLAEVVSVLDFCSKLKIEEKWLLVMILCMRGGVWIGGSYCNNRTQLGVLSLPRSLISKGLLELEGRG